MSALLAPGEIKVAPSILSADFGCLGDAVKEAEAATDWLHVDVMDGHFVPNLTIGPPVVAALRHYSGAFFDCHLMMTNPGDYLGAFKEAGADLATVHVEIGGTEALIEEMRGVGLSVGLAVSPETPYEAVAPYLAEIDLLLVMSVHPGFGGQHFIADVLAKVAAARRAIDEAGLPVALEIDGGIDEHTARLACAKGARVLVSGSAVFGEGRPGEAIARIAAAGRGALAGAS